MWTTGSSLSVFTGTVRVNPHYILLFSLSPTTCLRVSTLACTSPFPPHRCHRHCPYLCLRYPLRPRVASTPHPACAVGTCLTSATTLHPSHTGGAGKRFGFRIASWRARGVLGM
ncbi:hypothetical protein BC834DRAFT_484530 [Gloeopeniophorella convolvens]|nr:hypothetical protein BC834DRAFT_484530 [Gloeopeniophorella convolvens]